MQIEISTGNMPDVASDFPAYADTTVADKLSRFSERISRVVVHFSDENSAAKAGSDDKRCMLEVRLNGLQPSAVTANSGTLEQALDSAIDKTVKSLDRTLGKLNDPKGRMPYGGEPDL